jgi:hypothetical protein
MNTKANLLFAPRRLKEKTLSPEQLRKQRQERLVLEARRNLINETIFALQEGDFKPAFKLLAKKERQQWLLGKRPHLAPLVDELAVAVVRDKVENLTYETLSEREADQAISIAKERLQELFKEPRLSKAQFSSLFIESELLRTGEGTYLVKNQIKSGVKGEKKQKKWINEGLLPHLKERLEKDDLSPAEEAALVALARRVAVGNSEPFAGFRINRSQRCNLIVQAERQPSARSFIREMSERTLRYHLGPQKKNILEVQFIKETEEHLPQLIKEGKTIDEINEDALRRLNGICVDALEKEILERWHEDGDKTRAIEGLYSNTYANAALKKVHQKIIALDDLPRDILRRSLEAFANPAKSVQLAKSANINSAMHRSQDTFINLMGEHLGYSGMHCFSPAGNPDAKDIAAEEELIRIMN